MIGDLVDFLMRHLGQQLGFLGVALWLVATVVFLIPQHAVLPATTIVLTTAGLWLLPVRNAMVQTLDEGYIMLAEVKGLRAGRIMLAYAARNAILPTLANAGVQVGYIISGVILVEAAFSYPGVGLLLVNAVDGHDYPLIQGLLLLSAASTLLANFAVNLLSIWVDPRLQGG